MKIQQFTTLKKILIALLLCISASQSIAQNSNGIFFQAVARDNFSNPAKDRNIYVESSILQTTVNGTKVLVELHKTRTDAMGVFNITIGNGQRTGGSSTSIATIDWSKGPFYLNLKIAITPFSASDSWDYSKELVDIGTTSFGAVPFAFYSASSAKVSDKLDATDTTKMLAVYAKAMAVQSLATDVSTKLTAADTLTMLAPYAKAAYTIDSNFFRSQLATKLNITDTINYTKQKYTDSAFSKKLNIADSSSYVTPSKLAANLFDQTPLKNAIATKLNIADSSSYVTPSKLAANLYDQTPLKNAIDTKLNIADSTKYVTPTKLAIYYKSSAGSGTTIDTASLSNRINLKASTSDVTNAIALNTSTITTNTNAITANTADIITNRANITTNTSAITTNTTAITVNTSAINTNTSAIAAEATTARAAELALTNTLSSNTVNINANTASITANTSAIINLNSSTASNTTNIATNVSAISAEATTARAAELVLTNTLSSNTTNISSNTASITTNTSAITTNTTAITANTTAIAAEATTARAAELALTNTLSSNTASITANTSAITTNTIAITANTSAINTNTTAIAAEATTARAAELALTNNVNSNTTNITSNTSAIAANTASILTNTSDIALKATLVSPTFTGTPTAPTAAAGISTTQLATTAFVNNATSNINASSISGTVAVSKGGTGASTLTGYIKGSGTSVMTASASIPVGDLTGSIPILNGGTGQTTIAGIKSVLGLAGSVVAIGNTAGQTSQGPVAVAIGSEAGTTSQGQYAVAVGGAAGTSSQGTGAIAIGYVAGSSNQLANAIAIGSNAAQSGQATQSVAIGFAANSTGNNSIGIGTYASAAGINSIAIGYKATTTAANTIQLGGDGVVSGSTAITNVKTTGTLTAGTVTYPNAHNSTAGQLLSINASGTAAWTTPASSGGGTHAIGDSYCGGTVFYVWDGGAHGLIGAKAAVAINVNWSGNSTANTYANKQGILGGQFNTERILKTFPVIYVASPYFGMVNASIGAQPAAYIASSYRPDYIENGVSKKGLGDWYLPNLEEMEIMMKSGLFNYLTTTGTPSAHNAWWTSYERTDYPNQTSFFYGNTITNGVGTTNGSWSGKTSYQFNVTAIRSF